MADDKTLELFIKLTEDLRGDKLTDEEIESIRRRWAQVQDQLAGAGARTGKTVGTVQPSRDTSTGGPSEAPSASEGEAPAEPSAAPSRGAITGLSEPQLYAIAAGVAAAVLAARETGGTATDAVKHPAKPLSTARAEHRVQSREPERRDAPRRAHEGQHVRPAHPAVENEGAQHAAREAEQAHERQVSAAEKAYETMVRHNERNIELHERTAAKLAEQERKLEQVSKRLDSVHRNQ